METKRSFQELQVNLPSFIKRIDEKCQYHDVKLFVLNGQKVCGECQLNLKKSEYLAEVRKYCNENWDKLSNYYKQKKSRKKSTFDRGDV